MRLVQPFGHRLEIEDVEVDDFDYRRIWRQLPCDGLPIHVPHVLLQPHIGDLPREFRFECYPLLVPLLKRPLMVFQSILAWSGESRLGDLSPQRIEFPQVALALRITPCEDRVSLHGQRLGMPSAKCRSRRTGAGDAVHIVAVIFEKHAPPT